MEKKSGSCSLVPQINSELSFVDFVPKLVDRKPNFSTLSLSTGVQGPLFESYQNVIDRANKWLRQNPHARVISCETIEIECWYDTSSDEVKNGHKDNECFPAFLTILRIWIYWSLDDNSEAIIGRPRACQIAYRDILPSRLESSPKSFGPKYETMNAALQNFNTNLANGSDHTPGRLLKIQTCTWRFTSQNCSVDTNKTFWMWHKKSDIHCYCFFRLYYLLGPSEIYEIGFQDFEPSYSNGAKKQTKSEKFSHLSRRAEQWCISNQDLCFLNAQTINHNLFFRFIRDDIGSDQNVLDLPHCLLNAGQKVFHTKILRLYYLKSTKLKPEQKSTESTHILHKTFHVSSISFPPFLNKSLLDTNSILPHDAMLETVRKIAQWTVLKGVLIKGVETLALPIEAAKRKGYISAENTHFESIAGQPEPVVYAIRFFIDDCSTCLSKKDLIPEPQNVRLSFSSCDIL